MFRRWPGVIAVTVTLLVTSQSPASIGGPALSSATGTLPHPLGDRVLIDGTTGRPVPAFDGRRLYRVTYLPAGHARGPQREPDRLAGHLAGRGYMFQVTEYDDSGASLPATDVLRIASGMVP